MRDEGYIKYRIHWTPQPAPDAAATKQLEAWRRPLFKAGLIGQYDNPPIGFGNISMRCGEAGQFLITGTQTGHVALSNEAHYTLVTDYDIAGNELSCRGPVQASSEALTHAAIYELDPAINAVVHVHSQSLWDRYVNILPTTHPDIAYGTPEMAREFARVQGVRLSIAGNCRDGRPCGGTAQHRRDARAGGDEDPRAHSRPARPASSPCRGSSAKINVRQYFIEGTVSSTPRGLNEDARTALIDGFSKARFVLFRTATRCVRPARSISKQTCTSPSIRSRRALRGYSGATVSRGTRSELLSTIRATIGGSSSAANTDAETTRTTSVRQFIRVPDSRPATPAACGDRRL